MRTLVFAAALLAVPALVDTQPAAPRVESLASLEFPWGMAWLPDGRLLITEKPGRLRLFANGKLSAPITGLPAISYREGQTEQGGLLDVAVDPGFAQNRRIYISYAEKAPAPGGTPAVADDDQRFGGYLDLKDTRYRGGAIARAVLDGNRLSDVQVIWRQEPKYVGRGHFSTRMAWGADGAMFVTSGERMRFDPAQSASSNLGKVIRIDRDGRAATWSSGHRNMLAMALHPVTGKPWVFEMGPLGGDELNVIERGKNYGWPVVSDGDNYDKSPIPDHATRPEFEKPKRTWTPVISPSGALFYSGSLFPWKDHAIVGSLTQKQLVVLRLKGETVENEQRIDLGRRIRDVIEAQDGSLLVITDEKAGALLKLTPHH